MKNNIAVYGGAFNPPTNWHKFVIESIISKTKIEKIILNPDGPRIDKDYKIEKSYRREMIEMFLKDIKKIGIKIEFDDHFFNWQNGKDTTMMQQKEYYKNKLWFIPHFIFGTDTINTMPNWKDNIEQYIEQKLPKIFIPREWNKYSLKDFKNYQILDTKEINISSSNVKEVLIHNKQEVSELIIPEIRKYILKYNLYT
jgi:nicotinate-nucleotide adenylyltransferase